MNKDDSRPAAKLATWLAMPMETSARKTIERICLADDVVHVAVMPDVHLAADVCVGTAMATRRLIYPSAVGGDIGCGMLAVAFDAEADVVRDPKNAGAILRGLGEHIPSTRRHRARLLPLPLEKRALSHPSLMALLNSEGHLQFGTLGGGNHFIELQSDEDGRLWLMVHSGSRAVGQAIRAHHLAGATIRSASMMALDADTDAGRAYLLDHDWACQYAAANRAAMAEEVARLVSDLAKIEPAPAMTIACDHNHVRREEHFGQLLLVHRKGAMPADEGLPGAVPGSMGTLSFHVKGKGCLASLRSSAHGAGRLLSRQAARQRFGKSDLQRQMEGVWFDPRMSQSLREESPRAYKDVKAVMRAQNELITITRTLRPVLVYKGK
jgi:tRNA-splicing ligase RtcB (3'-phosphate/5'-hydroxy nucleic acid ligase)